MVQELKAGEGVLKMVIQVKRKDTGKIDEYELTGTATPEQFAELQSSIPVTDKEKE